MTIAELPIEAAQATEQQPVAPVAEVAQEQPETPRKAERMLTCVERPGGLFTLAEAAAIAGCKPGSVKQGIYAGKSAGGFTFAWADGGMRTSKKTYAKKQKPIKTAAAVEHPEAEEITGLSLTPSEIGNLIVALIRRKPNADASSITDLLSWAERVRKDHAQLQSMIGGAAPVAKDGKEVGAIKQRRAFL